VLRNAFYTSDETKAPTFKAKTKAEALNLKTKAKAKALTRKTKAKAKAFNALNTLTTGSKLVCACVWY